MTAMYIGADTFNAYRFDTVLDNRWVPLFTSETVPAADAVPPVNPEPLGCDGIAAAPSNRSIVYALWKEGIYKSIDAGNTWTLSRSGVTNEPNDDFRQWSARITVKPDDPNTCLAGTRQGLFRTANGGSTWTQVTSIPTPPDMGNTPRSNVGPGFCGMAWDPTNFSRVLVGSTTNGVYESLNAGATFSLMSGSPAGVGRGSAFGPDGRYYMVSNDNLGDGRTNDTSIWRYDGSWTQIDNQTAMRDIAVDPNNPNRLVACRTGGQIKVSLNGGNTWGPLHNPTRNNPLGAAEPGWLSWTTEDFFSSAEIMFDPDVPSRLRIAQGLGTWYADITSGEPSGDILWQSESRGIEQLVTNNVIWPSQANGGNGRPVVSTWDRGIFISPSDTTFPQTHGPSSIFDNCWHVSQDPFNEGTWVYSMGENGNGGSWTPEQSGYTTNNGSSWNQFGSIPLNSTHIFNTFGAGNVAISDGTIIWLSASNKGVYRSTNFGASWQSVNGNPAALFNQAYFVKRHVLTADQVVAGTFYAASSNGSGCWRSTDDGINWQNVGPIPNSNGAQFHSKLLAVPGQAGHLFYCVGHENGVTSGKPMARSTNGGVSWSTVPGTNAIWAFGYGAPDATNGATYPTIWAIGYFSTGYGLHYSTNEGATWTLAEQFPNCSLDRPVSIAGDMDNFGRCVVAFNGSGAALVDIINGVAK